MIHPYMEESSSHNMDVDQKNMSLVKMILEENEPIDKIVKYTDYSADKIKEIAESMGKSIAM